MVSGSDEGPTADDEGPGTTGEPATGDADDAEDADDASPEETSVDDGPPGDDETGTDSEGETGEAPPPDPQAGFEPVADVLGIAVEHDVHEISFLTTGQGWADLDRDGHLDLVVTNQMLPNRVFLGQRGGGFAEPDWAGDLALVESESSGVVFADYDGDAWIDVLILARGANTLLRNTLGDGLGGGGFEDVTLSAGVLDEGNANTATWGDYDGDGWLDLYVANNDFAPPDALYRNSGDGTFENVSSLLSLSRRMRPAFSASFFDYDNDGDVDLYVVNDKLAGNVLWRNDGAGCQGWCFTDVSSDAGADVDMWAMGLAVGDYDNDGDQDVFVSDIGEQVLLQNQTEQGQPVFVDVALDANAVIDVDGWGEYGWGAQFLDYDNDGWLDLYVAIGKFGGGATRPNVLLRNLGDGTFAEVEAVGGAAVEGRSFGVATADYDDDGWVDLLVGTINRPYELFRNLGGGHHWLTLDLSAAVGSSVCTDAVGTRVYLYDSDGGVQMREVIAGSSIGAGSSLRLHFGLGHADLVTAYVYWPDGTVEVHDDPPVDVRWPLVAPN